MADGKREELYKLAIYQALYVGQALFGQKKLDPINDNPFSRHTEKPPNTSAMDLLRKGLRMYVNKGK